MGNKRIYELAKELKKSSKDVVEKAQQLGIDVKNHMGAITSNDEKKLQQAFKNPSTKQQAAQQASRKPANQQPNDQRKKETTNNQQKNKNNRSYQDRGQGSGQVNQGKKPTTNQNNTGNTSSQNRQGTSQKNHMGAITSSDEKKLQQAFKNPSTKQQAAQQASRKPANQQPNDQRKKEATNNQQKNKNNRSYQDRGQGSGQVNQGKKPTTNQNNTGNTSSQNRQGTSQGGNQNRTNNNNKPNNNNRGKFNNNNRNRYNKKGKKGKQQQSTKPAVPPRKFRELPDVLEYTEGMNVADIAKKIHREPAEIIKKLFMLGVMVNQNQALDKDTIELLATDYGMEPQEKVQVDIADIDKFFEAEEVDPDKLVSRPPVVTIMGHVDHGKTTLLDTLRHSRVTSGEAGGITQHIGAYQIDIDGKPITFLDTPGHAAFTSMRARGASITDITILVVAADDGVMPQTVEAINHAKAAGVPIIVAVNKIDKPGANPQHVMQELSEYELIPEAWGGETIFVEISAKFGQNIEELLEMILLVAEVEDLKADPTQRAIGTVIEARSNYRRCKQN